MATINGTSGNDSLDGTAGDDSIFGDAGNDTLYASAGNDTLDGSSGIDQAIYNALGGGGILLNYSGLGTGSVTKPGGAGTDSFLGIEFVQGTSAVDTMNGSGADDNFIGSDGADTYNGSGGNDYISYGASGASSVTVSYSSFGNGTVTKNGLGTTDTLNSIEWVRGTANSGDSFSGSTSNDTFAGSTGSDSYTGNAGSDMLTYFNWGAETGRSIVVTYTSSTSQSIVKSSASGTDTTTSVEFIQGTPQNDVFNGSSGLDSYQGSLGEDTYTGNAGGGSLNDFLSYSSFRGGPTGVKVDMSVGTVDKMASGSGFGAGGSGTPDGGTDYISGINSVFGTSGNDYFQGGDPAHSLFLPTGTTEFFTTGAGNDTIIGTNDLINDVGSVFVFASYTNLTSLNGGVGINFNLSQNSFNKGSYSIAFGGGAIGFDTFDHLTGVVGTNVSDTLTGGGHYQSYTDFFSIMRPMAGNDIVNGGIGGDRVDYGNSTLGMTVFLYGQDSAGPTGDNHGVAMNGYSGGEVDTLVNIEGVSTGSGNDTLTGSDRTLNEFGYAMHETFIPGSGNNVIDGKAGHDIVQYNNVLAAISATVGGASGSVSHDGFTDTLANVEGVIASFFNDTLTGTQGATYQYFEGLGGNDSINANNTLAGALNEASYQRSGGPVNASLVTGIVQDGYGNTDTLTGINGLRGSMWDDTLVGSAAGGEVFRGMSGLDVMISGGGAFDEVRYDLDAQPGWLGPDQGVSINLGTGQALDGWGMPDRVLGFTAAVGSPWNDTITGGGGDDKLNGIEGTDLIMGGNGHDSLTGGAGDDTLDGGASTDTMIGGLGDDAYMVDSSGDSITENASEGNDFVALADVYVSTSYTMPTNIEGLLMSGSRSTALTAHASDNFIRGNNGGNLINGLGGADTIDGGAGNDQLNGGIGKDTLIGGLGNDTFLFNAPITSANSDLIKDFHGNTATENDQLAFSHARFLALAYDTVAGGTQALDPAEFTSGNGLANDPSTPVGVNLIYDSGSGRLYYDADAEGAGAKVLIAMFTGHPTVTASDILVSP
jgi:Ca2+-binding RTX toxin-like protein